MVQMDLRLHPELNPISRRERSTPKGAEGGALTKADVQHFLTVPINKLREAADSAKERGVAIPRSQSSAQTVAAEAAAEEGAFTLHETLATLSRLLESGIASSKILERSQDVLAGVARLADKLSAKDSQELAQGIEDAADEAESQATVVAKRRGRPSYSRRLNGVCIHPVLPFVKWGSKGFSHDHHGSMTRGASPPFRPLVPSSLGSLAFVALHPMWS
jgi:hypothetical protein